MYVKLLVGSLLLLFVSSCVQGQQVSCTYLDPTTDSTTNYYIAHTPTGNIKGLLLLLPGFGETPFAADTETSLPEAACAAGLLTVIATLPSGVRSFYIDTKSQNDLDKLIDHLFNRYALRDKKFYLGGFSLGGAGAVKYAQRAARHKQLNKPNAVFAIDPPLDIERLYKSQEKALHSRSEVAVTEAAYFIERIRSEMGGTPAQNINTYYKISPFSSSDPNQKAVLLLRNQPILLVSEPALHWNQKERGRGFEDLNAYDCEQLIKSLQQVGNLHAFLQFTEQRGFRKQQNEYHPHAWSIADESATVSWLLNY